ncbi:MAG: hypothetical protein DRH93_11680 [Deltaproteobacteria bacterium]|nr:MAG: hypothetical protein DRH93_11680 [Deltaproteobacteria bacterium]
MAELSLVLNSQEVALGLRKEKKQPKNTFDKVELTGMITQEGMLRTNPVHTRIDTSIITDGFPYPQLFVLNKVVIICGRTDIYEWNGTALIHKINVTGGMIWKVMESFNFIYLTNGEVSVKRDPWNKYYTLDDEVISHALCNYNGQVLAGSYKRKLNE